MFTVPSSPVRSGSHQIVSIEPYIPKRILVLVQKESNATIKGFFFVLGVHDVTNSEDKSKCQ